MMKIYSSFYDSPIGSLLLQCTNEYLVAILYNKNDEVQLAEKHKILTETEKQLDEYFDGSRKEFDLPIKQPGTEFQLKIWDLLYKIPFGETISYSDLSKQYGEPKAIRAVASANGKNKINIIIPCHRVIGTNQSLTGYSGGLWRKKWLLEHEAKCKYGQQQLFSLSNDQSNIPKAVQ